MTEQYNEPRCKICQHPSREIIDKALMDGIKTNRELCKIYGLSENAMSVHKHKHLIMNIKDKLKDLVVESITKGIVPENTSDLVKLMDYVSKMSDENFLHGKKEFDTEKYKMFERFKKALKQTLPDGTLLFDYTTKDVDTILALAKLCFVDTNRVEEGKMDLGDFIRDIILEPADYLKSKASNGSGS